MNDRDMEPLLAAMERRLADVSSDLHRSMYSQIDWDDRLVCIKGAKGTDIAATGLVDYSRVAFLRQARGLTPWARVKTREK